MRCLRQKVELKLSHKPSKERATAVLAFDEISLKERLFQCRFFNKLCNFIGQLGNVI